MGFYCGDTAHKDKKKVYKLGHNSEDTNFTTLTMAERDKVLLEGSCLCRGVHVSTTACTKWMSAL